ncbi:MAG TPA: phytanoyl-CoA dioxygenase family protein [Usitatibacter sp.]|nr:phytanoyl-CoA dioxygenase family protein [Usitatibacter sp.]
MKLSSPARGLNPATLKEDVASFWKRGFIIVRGVFTREEMGILKDIITRHADMQAHAARAKQRSAGSTRPSFETVFVWNDTARNDAFAKATRSRKIMDRLEAIFEDEVYVYHNKVALKYPGVVGFSHHQDYWYWYQMGNVFPDMATAMVAVDRHTQANGCLKLVEGSHRLGRLEHVYRDGVSDSGVDPERLNQILKVMPEVPIELEIGDVALFHCNTLHASDDNHSNESRIGLLGCYNTRHNNPYKQAHGHPGWHPQQKIEEPIGEADRGNLPDFAYQWRP